MRWDPVEYHSYAGLMEGVYHFHEVCWAAEAGGWSVVANCLISPRTVEWVLAKGHKLDVSVVHLFHVGDKLLRHFGIAEIISVRILSP